MIAVAVIVATWVVLSVPLALAVGWLTQYGRTTDRPRLHARREPRHHIGARHLLHLSGPRTP